MARDERLAVSIAGDEASVREDCLAVFERELDYIARSLRRLGLPRADVEDATHEVFLVVHRRWSDYDPAQPIRPWLFGIAFRVAAAQRRRWWRETPRPAPDIEDLAPRPDDVVSARQARRMVLQALERIPLPRRAILVMHDLDGTEMHAIASTLSIPLFTAYSRLRKARREFAAAIKREARQQP